MDGMSLDPRSIQARKRKELLSTLLEKGEAIVKERFIKADPVRYNDNAVALADDLTCVSLAHLSNYIHAIFKDDPIIHRELVGLIVKIIDYEIEYADQLSNGILPIQKEPGVTN